MIIWHITGCFALSRGQNNQYCVRLLSDLQGSVSIMGYVCYAVFLVI